jgi:hypothetical protein
VGWSELAQDQGQLVGFCEDCNEASSYIKDGGPNGMIQIL